MDDRMKELVAVGASVAVNCQGCLKYHREKALEAGANPLDIAEAVETGQMVGRGAAKITRKYAAELLASKTIKAA